MRYSDFLMAESCANVDDRFYWMNKAVRPRANEVHARIPHAHFVSGKRGSLSRASQDYDDNLEEYNKKVGEIYESGHAPNGNDIPEDKICI